jgi:hypothetical protein
MQTHTHTHAHTRHGARRRQVVVSEPGFKRVEVEQCGELRVMW